MKHILIIRHIKIQNANALSSPYTIGFPAMTAWLGAVHALQRKLNNAGFPNLLFKSTAIICHDFHIHTYKHSEDFVESIIGTGNPLDRNGDRPSFIEEARCRLTISLIIEHNVLSDRDEEQLLLEKINVLLPTMKIASGDILDFQTPKLTRIADDGLEIKKLQRSLMPSYTLIERRDLMRDVMLQDQNAIDALLDHLKVMHRSEEKIKNNNKIEIKWTTNRKSKGWIVPIATGFHGISPIAPAINQRDPLTPHRFAESVVTLGEFVMLCRINNLDDMLWHSYFDDTANLYLCQQNNQR